MFSKKTLHLNNVNAMIYYTLDVIIVERDGVETETDRTEFYKTGYSSVSSKSDAKKRSEIEMCIAPDIII